MSDMTITYDDGSTHETDIKPADLIAFERKYGLEWDDARDHPKIEHPFFMAWNYLRRTSSVPADFPGFDEWLDKVADLDVIEAEAEAGKAKARPRPKR